MNKVYRFWYHLLKGIPFKTKRIQTLCDHLRFYYRGNILTLVYPDGKRVENPLCVPPFLHLKASGWCSGNHVIVGANQKKGFFH